MEPYKDQGPLNCDVDFDKSYVKGKTAIVTGGANGIGEAYVRELAKSGAFVAIGDLDEKAGKDLASELNGVFVKCDITSWDEQLSLFKEAISASPTHRIDIVVANAGISGVCSIFDYKDQEEPEKPNLNILRVDLMGTMYTVKLALHYFQRQHAKQPELETCLVLQGSTAGYMETPATLEYCASKFGLRGVMRSLRRTSWMHNTRVNYVAPAYIKTKIISEQFASKLAETTPFATLDEASDTLMRLICDPKAHGRALAVIPKPFSPRGYIDFDDDDFKDGNPMQWMQDKAVKTGQRFKDAMESRGLPVPEL